MVKNGIMSRERKADGSGALTGEDWVRAAGRVVSEGGIQAVAVEPLAKRLGVTKGSFYWHFRDRRALIEAVLGRWEEEATEAAISATEKVADPRERLVRLAGEAFGDGLRFDDASLGQDAFRGVAFELAVSDAADDPIVRPFLRRVTGRRIGYLEECYRALGFPREGARHRALLVYAAHAGTVRLFRDVPDRVPRGEGYLAYRRHLVDALVHGDRTEPNAPAAMPTRPGA
jgi:AcrR family transcriptional regulator